MATIQLSQAVYTKLKQINKQIILLPDCKIQTTEKSHNKTIKQIKKIQSEIARQTQILSLNNTNFAITTGCQIVSVFPYKFTLQNVLANYTIDYYPYQI